MLKRPGTRQTPAKDAGNTGYDPGIYSPNMDGVDGGFGMMGALLGIAFVIMAGRN